MMEPHFPRGFCSTSEMWKHKPHLYDSHTTAAPTASPHRKTLQAQYQKLFKKETQPIGLKSFGNVLPLLT